MTFYYQNRNVDFYCRDSKNTGTTLGIIPHIHSHIELALLFKGHTEITVDSEVFEVCAGDGFIIFPNQLHSFHTLEREKYILFIISPELIPEFSGIINTKLPSSYIVKGLSEDTETVELMKRISEIYDSEQEYKDVLIRGYLLVFLSRLFGKLEFNDAHSKDTNVVGDILNYCTLNYTKDISLAMLEQELHVSKYYISHIMSSKLRISLNDYVNSLRVAGACKYLLKSDKSITEISELVGFNTIRTFNRAFVKQMGITPSEYRAKKQNIPFRASMPIK